MRIYRKDLARVHDAGFDASARTAPFFLSLLRGRGIRSGLVVDLGCGGGRWALALTRAGYEALGVDISAEMVKLARRRAPKARFLRGSLHAVRIPPCAAITAFGEAAAYGASEARLVRFFKKTARALRPGGVLLLDLRAPSPGKKPETRTASVSARGWEVEAISVESLDKRFLTRTIVAVRSGKRSREVHRLALFRPAFVLAALRRAGFRARTLRRYGSQPLPATLVGYLATN